MTAQEAAKVGWSRFKAWRYKAGAALLFTTGSILGAAFWRDELHQLWIWFLGVAPGAIGTLMIVLEKYFQRTDRVMTAKINEAAPSIASSVSSAVVDEMRSEMRGLTRAQLKMRRAQLKMGASMVLLTAQQAETEATRATDHQQNRGQVDGLRQDVEAIKTDVQDLKGKFTRHDTAIDMLTKLIPVSEGLQKNE